MCSKPFVQTGDSKNSVWAPFCRIAENKREVEVLRCRGQNYLEVIRVFYSRWWHHHLAGTSAICGVFCGEFDYSPWTPSYISKSDWLETVGTNASAEDDLLLMYAGGDSSQCFRKDLYSEKCPWEEHWVLSELLTCDLDILLQHYTMQLCPPDKWKRNKAKRKTLQGSVKLYLRGQSSKVSSHS